MYWMFEGDFLSYSIKYNGYEYDDKSVGRKKLNEMIWTYIGSILKYYDHKSQVGHRVCFDIITIHDLQKYNVSCENIENRRISDGNQKWKELWRQYLTNDDPITDQIISEYHRYNPIKMIVLVISG